MKQIIIKTQEDFNKIKRVEADEELICEEGCVQLEASLEVFGLIKGRFKTEWGKHIILLGSSHAVLWESSHAVLRESSHAVLRESSHAVLRESSHAELWGSSHAVLRGSSHAVLWESSHAVLRESSSVNIFSCDIEIPLKLLGFSVALIPVTLKLKIQKSRTAMVQKYKLAIDWFELNGVEKTKKIILFKRVSKDFKTQEGTDREALWTIGSKVTHPAWSPENNECGSGKYHACSRPYFCDELRDNHSSDKYIAIEILRKDTYTWKNPTYPHKIAFREGTVLYECDRMGNKI